MMHIRVDKNTSYKEVMNVAIAEANASFKLPLF